MPTDVYNNVFTTAYDEVFFGQVAAPGAEVTAFAKTAPRVRGIAKTEPTVTARAYTRPTIRGEAT